MKKKIFKIVLVNIALILFFVFVVETYIYNVEVKYIKHPFYLPNYSFKDCIDSAENYSRNFFHTEYKKPPLWIMGCSYAWGYLLEAKESFPEKLSTYTKRPVYNWAFCGIGPAEVLIRLFTDKNDKFLPQEPPEYVIYVYMYNHVNRYPNNDNLLYALKELNVIEGKNTIFDKLFFIQAIKQRIFNKNIVSGHDSAEKHKQFMKKIFFALKDEVHKKFPETKFVILLYNDTDNDLKDGHESMVDFAYETLNSEKYWEEYEKNGFIVISTKELIGREMNLLQDRIPNDTAETPHPTAEVWDKIIPELQKKLNL